MILIIFRIIKFQFISLILVKKFCILDTKMIKMVRQIWYTFNSKIFIKSNCEKTEKVKKIISEI